MKKTVTDIMNRLLLLFLFCVLLFCQLSSGSENCGLVLTSDKAPAVGRIGRQQLAECAAALLKRFDRRAALLAAHGAAPPAVQAKIAIVFARKPGYLIKYGLLLLHLHLLWHLLHLCHLLPWLSKLRTRRRSFWMSRWIHQLTCRQIPQH